MLMKRFPNGRSPTFMRRQELATHRYCSQQPIKLGMSWAGGRSSACGRGGSSPPLGTNYQSGCGLSRRDGTDLGSAAIPVRKQG